MSFHKDALRTTSQTALKITYLIRIGVGSVANIILFFHSISPILLGHNRRPTPTILAHISIANLLFFLSSGIPHIMTGFVLRNPLSSLGCKFLYYIQRVTLSTALCSTRVLSTYQAFTLIPRRAEWMMLRGRAPRVTGPSCCTCWMLSLLMSIPAPLKITGHWDRYNNTDSQGKWFCSASGTVTGFGYFWFISDVMFIDLMVWSSCSMVLLLHRHHQRVQYIHTPTGHRRCPRRPEPPHHPDARGHLCHLLHAELQFCFSYQCLFRFSSAVDPGL